MDSGARSRGLWGQTEAWGSSGAPPLCAALSRFQPRVWEREAGNHCQFVGRQDCTQKQQTMGGAVDAKSALMGWGGTGVPKMGSEGGWGQASLLGGVVLQREDHRASGVGVHMALPGESSA